MSVVGIDFGSQSTKIGVARNKGIDIITNEVSNRSTPSLVGFGPKSRYIGEAAKTQEISNLKNTVGTLRRLAGRSFKDPDVQIEQDYNTATLIDINGEAGAEVSYLGKKEQFTATQLVAMFLTKIKTTVASELKLPVADVVLSVPPWFTDAQRRSLLDASEIAGLTCLRLINDSTAIALGWGITKFDLPSAEEKPRRVVFVDIGHSDYTCSVVEFRKGELNVKATTYDRHFGGRNFDKALVDHFAKEFKEKFKIDIRTNLKAWTRTLAAAEKLKKILSANASAPMSIESLMDDVDVRSFVKREELETMIQPLLDRVTVPLEQALAEAKLKPEDIDSIEMVGGCTRIPIIKEKISEFFGKPLSFTLNQDEAVARGCAFSCATLSPVFRVRDFSVHDIVNYPIEFTWEQAPEIPDEATSLTVFNKGNVMPSTKILTFYRKQPFDIEARYAKPEGLPGKANPWIGHFSVKGVTPNPDGDFATCKLRARLNLHGILNIESGYYVEDVEVEEPIPEKEGEAMDTDAPNGEAAEAKPKMRKVKKQVRKGDLPISSGTAGLDDWLYEDGEDTTKAVYIAKMDEIRFVAGPIIQRHADKVEAERMAAQKAQEEAAAKKRAEQEAAKKNAAPAGADAEMKDADSASPRAGDEPMPEVEEAS
ncbi:hsp88-like protein [Histoplasma capsulatum]|uniref:Hsp88-like protein n=1 Tax=Ajellomyces capsulatus TaxID=5037 RepID=A0A8A1LZ37_AJECA|nr:hsp88-like protein [Histoplasma capsulatum]